jgi:hypothetical protein
MITRRSHIKYAKNMHLKSETNGLDGILLENRLFKKNALKTNFRCESYSLLKKGINGNQRSIWKAKVGPHGDTPPSNNITFTNKLFMK